LKKLQIELEALGKAYKKMEKKRWFSLYKINHEGNFFNFDEPVKFNESLSKFLSTSKITNLD